ncbi:MAG: hypothetical protein HRT68_04585 [Flavobacteriaceae bacterium]|nr:hypothetical protein [Flavobacteriaceae bacterium]
MKKVFLIISLSGLIIASCSKSEDNGGGDNGNGNNPTNTAPVASSYTSPNNNETCTGTETSPTTIQVSFSWTAFQDAEDSTLDYTLTITNQSTNAVAETIQTTSTSGTANLEKGVTYSWTVRATDSEGLSATGSVWQFQTPFDATSNYAPFPATMISPTNGEVLTSNNVTLSWQGNDPDVGETALLVYDVYLGNTNPPTIVSTDQTAETYDTTLTSGIYFWRIISKDLNGNESESQIRQFEVQ